MAEYFTLGTYLAVIPSIFISLFVIYNCTLYSERHKDKAILVMLKKPLTAFVNRELADRKNVHELKRMLFYKYKGTYGAVESRSVLVLLSDKTVLAYPLFWRVGDKPYYELESDVQICLDSERIEFICPRTIKDIIGGFRVSDDNKLRIILFGLLFVSLSILIGIGWLVYVFGQKVLFYFVAYLGAITVLNILQDLVKNRLVSTLKGDYAETSFDFLGFTFRGRGARNNKTHQVFTSYLPAMSKKAYEKKKEEIRSWKYLRNYHLDIEDLSVEMEDKVRGWILYYTKFGKTEFYKLTNFLNERIVCWARRKYKRFKGKKLKAREWLVKLSQAKQWLFYHWQVGYVPYPYINKNR